MAAAVALQGKPLTLTGMRVRVVGVACHTLAVLG